RIGTPAVRKTDRYLQKFMRCAGLTFFGVSSKSRTVRRRLGFGGPAGGAGGSGAAAPSSSGVAAVDIPHHLGDRRDAGVGTLERFLERRSGSIRLGSVAKLLDRRLGHDEPFHLLGHPDELEHSDPVPIARMSAERAPLPVPDALERRRRAAGVGVV